MLDILIKLYFGSLFLFSLFSSLYLFCNRTKRFPYKELADYKSCPFWKEIQYDMGLLTVYNLYFFGKPKISYGFHPSRILDIGSGNGVTSTLMLRAIFGDYTDITLSDIHPNIQSWKTIKNVNFLRNPINVMVDDISGYTIITLFNSLHHLDYDDINSLLERADSDIFIMDAKRLSPLHPLLVPNFYFCIYLLLAISGTIQRGEFFQMKTLPLLVVEPWIMCMDQMIGSMKRYHLDVIRSLADKHSYRINVKSDNLMNYILMTR
jgi:hypothetical protein